MIARARTALGLLRLYRAEVFIIFGLLYFLGANSAADAAWASTSNVLVALLIAGVSVNFIYSFNSWADAEIDRINKPSRPIPSGAVSRPQALAYSLVLLALSLVYPLFLFSPAYVAAFWWFPLAGLLYSAPFFYLKKRRVLALLLIGGTAVWTALLGYFLNGGGATREAYTAAAALFCACAAIIPLKDLSDIEGDRAEGAANWFAQGKHANKFASSAAFFITAVGLAALTGKMGLVALSELVAVSFALLVLVFWLRGIAWQKFYRVLLLTIILDMLLVYVISFFDVFSF